MFGHMRLLGSGAYRGLLIPDQAIVTDQSQQVVYVVDGGNKVVQRAIQAGPLLNGLRVIRSGIGAGDRVVIEGVQRAKPGLKITPKPGRITPTTQDATGGDYLSPPAASATSADVMK